MNELRPRRIDSTALLRSPLFWAMHFTEQTDGCAADDYFDASPDEIEAFWRETFSSSVPGEPDTYPCYCIVLPIAQGALAWVEYRAYPEDFGIDYYVHRPSWPSALLIGSKEGHFSLPAFRWTEITQMATVVQNADPLLHHAVVPLLFSSVWLTQVDDRAEMHRRLCLDWGALGVVKPGRMDEMVSRIMEMDRNPDVQWRYDTKFGWINDSQWSLRNPAHNPSETFFQKMREFLAVSATTGQN